MYYSINAFMYSSPQLSELFTSICNKGNFQEINSLLPVSIPFITLRNCIHVLYSKRVCRNDHEFVHVFPAPGTDLPDSPGAPGHVQEGLLPVHTKWVYRSLSGVLYEMIVCFVPKLLYPCTWLVCRYMWQNCRYRWQPGVGDIRAVLPVAVNLRPQYPRWLHHARPTQTRLLRWVRDSGSVLTCFLNVFIFFQLKFVYKMILIVIDCFTCSGYLCLQYNIVLCVYICIMCLCLHQLFISVFPAHAEALSSILVLLKQEG